MTLVWVVDVAFAARSEDIAAKQGQDLGQLGVFFLQLAVVGRGLVKHALELVDAALSVFGLPLSVFGLPLSVFGSPLQLVVAAEQVIDQPLALTRIVGEMWYDAHDMNYSRVLMFGKSSMVDFSGFLTRWPACRLHFRLPSPRCARAQGRKRRRDAGKPEDRERHQPQQEGSHSMTAVSMGLGKTSTRQTAAGAGSGDSAGVLEPFALACTAEVDSGEDHGQLRRLEFDAVALGDVRHLEGTAFKSLVPDGQAVTIEVEDLEAIPAAVEEEEEMAGQEVLLQSTPEPIPDRPSKLFRMSVGLVQRNTRTAAES